MRKVLAVLAVTALLGATGGHALADCSADISKVEPAIMNIPDASKKATAESELKEAKVFAQNKDAKDCLTYLQAAKKTAGIK